MHKSELYQSCIDQVIYEHWTDGWDYKSHMLYFITSGDTCQFNGEIMVIKLEFYD